MLFSVSAVSARDELSCFNGVTCTAVQDSGLNRRGDVWPRALGQVCSIRNTGKDLVRLRIANELQLILGN